MSNNSTDTFIIYDSREQAWLSLLTSEIKSGKLYARHFKTSEDKVDLLMAYGTKDCSGYPDSKESLKIIHGESPIVVEKVFIQSEFPVTPDMIVHGETYFFYNTEQRKSYLLTRGESNNPSVSYTVITIPFEFTSFKLIYETYTGTYYFAKEDTIKSLSDFLTVQEFEKSLEHINNLLTETTELRQVVFPLTGSVSFTPSYIESSKAVDVKVTYNFNKKTVKGSTDVTDNCYVEIRDKDNNLIIPENGYIKGVTDSNTYTVTAYYESDYEYTVTKSVSSVSPIYWGVISRDVATDSVVSSVMTSGHKLVQPKGTVSVSCDLDINLSLVFMYPAKYGAIKSIKDNNGFDYINDYQISTTGDYNVYYKISPVNKQGCIQIFSFN